MEKLKKLLKDMDKPLTKEQLESIIYNLFCTIIFVMPIIPEQIGAGIYSLKNTIFNLVTIATIISLCIINRKKFNWNVYDILCGIYIFFVTISTIFTRHGIYQCILGINGRGEGMLTILSYISTFIICSKGYTHIKKTFVIAIIGVVVVSVYSIIQANLPLSVKLPFGSPDFIGVAEGTMGNQNFLSSYLCMFLPMLCYHFLNTKGYRTIFGVALVFTAFVYSKTLGGYLVFAVMYVAICIFSIIYNSKKKLVLAKIIMMSLTLVCIFTLLNYTKEDSYAEELAEVKDEVVNLVNESEQFGTNRLGIWKRVLMAIDNNKFLGVGPDSLSNEFEQDKYHIGGQEEFLVKYDLDKAHCEYLHIAATTGVPSLLVYLTLVIIISLRLLTIVIKINKASVQNQNKLFITLVFISMVSYLAQALANISVVQVAPLFWVILGLGAGVTLNEKVS